MTLLVTSGDGRTDILLASNDPQQVCASSLCGGLGSTAAHVVSTDTDTAVGFYCWLLTKILSPHHTVSVGRGSSFLFLPAGLKVHLLSTDATGVDVPVH